MGATREGVAPCPAPRRLEGGRDGGGPSTSMARGGEVRRVDGPAACAALAILASRALAFCFFCQPLRTLGRPSESTSELGGASLSLRLNSSSSWYTSRAISPWRTASSGCSNCITISLNYRKKFVYGEAVLFYNIQKPVSVVQLLWVLYYFTRLLLYNPVLSRASVVKRCTVCKTSHCL